MIDIILYIGTKKRKKKGHLTTIEGIYGTRGGGGVS